MSNTLISEMTQLNTRLDELSRLIESEYESNKAISIFQYFDKIYTLCYGTSNLSTLMDTLIQKKYTELCYPIFRRIHTDVFKNQQSWHVTYYLLHSLWNYTDKSNGMCIAVVETKFVPLLMYNLKQENYLKHFASNDAIRKLFDMIVSILHNIAQVPELVEELRRNQCLEILNRVIQTVGSSRVFLKGLCYLTLAYIIREDERTTLTNSNESIPYLVNLLHEAISSADRRSNGLEARELCKGLSKLSVAENNKFKIFSEAKLLDSVLNMLEQHSNGQEQISACTLIWNLSFDANVRKVYHDHKQLNQILSMIAQSSSNDELRRTASGCLCTLMGGPTITTKASSNTTATTGQKNIMISYNHDVKQLCKQIKDHLAEDGYDVWIDLENMHGNLLDAMADAIENSSIFLMCLTERYKDSPSCRLECEYAYQRKKKIIPLLLQANYKPDGWLGIILGTKLYVNYAKKSFDTAYSETITELQTAMKTTDKRSAISPPAKKPAPLPETSRPSSATAAAVNESTTGVPPNTLVHLMSQFRMDKASEPTPLSGKALEKMSITDTQRFLAESGLEKFMVIFTDMDGVKLLKLFEIKTKAPQCYYLLIKDKWDQMNQAKDRNRDTSSPVRTIASSSSMAQFLQLMIILDKLADRFSIN